MTAPQIGNYGVNPADVESGKLQMAGFVVREAADAVTIRTITAVEQTIPVAQIAKREKQERSLMPEGLAAGLSMKEFASLLDYLESLSKK